MSGGSLDYVFYRVDEAADQVAARAENVLHRAFAAHLKKVAKALHDIEWMFSADTSPGDEIAAIKAVLSPTAELDTAIEEAKRAQEELRRLLATAQERSRP